MLQDEQSKQKLYDGDILKNEPVIHHYKKVFDQIIHYLIEYTINAIRKIEHA